MLAEPEFDAVVAGFYAAATGEIVWGEALAPVHVAFRARAAVVQSIDVQTGVIVQYSYAGDSMPEDFLAYLRRWHEVDPRRSHILAHVSECVGKWWHCHEHLNEDFVAHDEFYQDFLPAQRTRYLATSIHQPASDTLTAFALELPARRGPLNADERHLAERLSRHFNDAMRAYERVRRLASRVLAGHALLDTFAYPMWLVDADRVILHGNPAAHAFAMEDDRLTLRGRRFYWHGRVDHKIRDVLQALGSGVRHGQRLTLDARTRPEEPASWLHLHVMDPARVLGGAFGERPMLLITLFDPRRMSELDAFALTEMFGMTPAEGRIAALLGEGLSAQAMAVQLGCQESTVRTHLRNVLHRLGASRGSDAVRILRQGEALWSLRPPQSGL